MILPRILLAGAPRCGTSSLFKWLGDHPGVCPTLVKETYYLMDAESPHFNASSNYAIHGLSGYASWFPSAVGERLPLDATPDYMYQKTAIEAATAMRPSPKVMFLLRKPSERALSHYRYFGLHQAGLPPSLTFSEYVAALQKGERFDDKPFAPPNLALFLGYYARLLEPWAQVLGRENLGIFVFEDMRAAPREFMEKVCGFLGLDAGFYDTYDFQKRNAPLQVRSRFLHKFVHTPLNSVLPRGRIRHIGGKAYRWLNRKEERFSLTPEIRETLRQLDALYEDDVRQLCQQFGLDLSAWQTARKGAQAAQGAVS